MFAKTTFSISALLALTSAQSAPGFPIQASQQLTINYGNNTVSPPGELIPRGETARAPSISTPIWYSDSTANRPSRAVLLMVDLDVPRNGTRVQLVHWIATDITLGNSTSSLATPLNIPAAPVPYVQPSPPVGDVPHSYSFILFAQPGNFSIPAAYANLTQNRVFFNTSKFVSDAGLTQPLAANYIRVQNLTGSATTSFPPARPTATGGANGSAPGQFPGAAQSLMAGGVTFWAAVGTALLTGVAAVAL